MAEVCRTCFILAFMNAKAAKRKYNEVEWFGWMCVAYVFFGRGLQYAREI